MGQSSSREILKLKAIGLAELSAETNHEWGDWNPINEFVILNPKLARIIVTGSDDFFFEIFKSKLVETSQENVVMAMEFDAYDAVGDKCNLELVKYDNGHSHLYLNYAAYRWVFDLRQID